MNKDYVNLSPFASYIHDFIATKRSEGFIYLAEERTLADFDALCCSQRIAEVQITQELAELWSIQRATENLNSRNSRVVCLRQFALYLSILGDVAYIPRTYASEEKPIPHIPSEKEISEFLTIVDTYSPENNDPRFQRIKLIYPILFRLLYCCGLRLSEACYLRCRHFNLSTGEITILHSKGDKDRLVYVSSDLLELCNKYNSTIEQRIPHREWFFPGWDVSAPIRKTSVDKKFQQFWHCTAFSTVVEKHPTPQCFRHAFCCHRIRKWLEEGLSFEVMMPYLSKYMGHASIEETHYYYHHIESIFPTIAEHDTQSQTIIPEVIPYV